MNFIEYVTPAIVMTLVGGMHYPNATICAGSLFFIARILYTIGYSVKAAYRAPGFMLNMLAIFALLTTSILSINTMYQKMNSIVA
jgi:uncharacterized MAPEG superfamily protein